MGKPQGNQTGGGSHSRNTRLFATLLGNDGGNLKQSYDFNSLGSETSLF
jgi:hypothetical protein